MKELFEREAPKVVRKTRFQMHKAIDPDYYGFRDEEDGVLVRVEAEAEKLMRTQVQRRSRELQGRSIQGRGHTARVLPASRFDAC